MKKTFTLFALLFSFISFSQTTLEEYNYMTKGYRIQLESGLDMKKGYSISSNAPLTDSYYTFSFNFLTRSDKSYVGTIVIAKSNVSGKVYYFGIPFNNSDLTAHYNSEVAKLDESMTTSYLNVMSLYYSSLCSVLQDIENNKKK